MSFLVRAVLLAVALSTCVLVGAGQAPQNNNSKAQATQAPNTTLQPNEVPNAKVTSPAIPATAKVETFVGKVSDVNCGPRHFMLENATDAECTRACFARRGLYALVVGEKVYALVNQPGAILNELAGKEARITGSLMNSNTIAIDTVSPLNAKP